MKLGFARFLILVPAIFLIACGPARDDALWELARAGDLEGVQLAIQRGADVDSVNGNRATLVMAATGFRQVQLLEFLLEAGANPDIPSLTGATPLYLASMIGDVDSVRLLLEFDANPNIGMNQFISTPLMSAAVNRKVEIVRLLLDHGADINARNPEGKTVMDLYEGALQPEVRRVLEGAMVGG